MAAPVVVAQQVGAALERQDDRCLPLVHRQEDGVTAGLRALRDMGHRLQPTGPGARRAGVAGGAEDVRPVEEQTRVDVPRHAPGGAVDHVGVEDAGEVIAAVDRAGGADALVQGLDGPQGDELGDPGIADLEHVGHRVTDVGCQQLLVRRAPRDLLHADARARVAALELRDHPLHHLPLASESPELDHGLLAAVATTAGRGHDHQRREEEARPESDRGRTRVRSAAQGTSRRMAHQCRLSRPESSRGGVRRFPLSRERRIGPVPGIVGKAEIRARQGAGARARAGGPDRSERQSPRPGKSGTVPAPKSMLRRRFCPLHSPVRGTER